MYSWTAFKAFKRSENRNVEMFLPPPYEGVQTRCLVLVSLHFLAVEIHWELCIKEPAMAWVFIQYCPNASWCEIDRLGDSVPQMWGLLSSFPPNASVLLATSNCYEWCIISVHCSATLFTADSVGSHVDLMSFAQLRVEGDHPSRNTIEIE